MPCGCIDVCNCFLEDTDTISVTGSGTAADPYLATVIPDPDGGLFNTVNGVSILLDPDPNNQATLSVAGLFVACCSACVTDSDTIDFEIDIDGCVTGEVILDPDGGLVSTPPDGIGIVIDPSSTAPISVGPLGLRVDCCGDIEAPCPVDVQVFEIDGEWTQPADAEWVDVVLIGGGAGAGSGEAGATLTNRSGGGGGGAAGLTIKRYRASDLPAIIDVTVGPGGTGGAAVGPGASPGTNGSNGSATIFGTLGTEFATAGGGTQGVGGSGLSGSGGGGALKTSERSFDSSQGGSAPGANGSQNNGSSIANLSGLTPGGGGGGGGLNTTDTQRTGGQGGYGDYAGEENARGTTGAVGGGDGGDGGDSTTLAGGGGGGGGGSSNVDTVDGGDGGNGGLYGAGGGGGGAATSGGTAVSGAGGDGAPGVAIVVTHLCAEGGASGGGVPLGTGVDFWGEEADVPLGWVLAYGQLLDATTYTDWLALVGTTYGGDGIATVGVPDKRDRVSVGKGDMGGVDAGLIGAILPATLGATAGASTLTTAQLAAHAHGVTDPGHRHSPSNSAGFVTGGQSSPADAVGAEFKGQSTASFTNIVGTGISIQNAGSGAEHLQPSIVCNYIIKVLP